MLGWYIFSIYARRYIFRLKYIDHVCYNSFCCDYSLLGIVLQLRVDGVLMRLRDTRMHCSFKESTEPVILREICWREATFKALSSVSVIHFWLISTEILPMSTKN